MTFEQQQESPSKQVAAIREKIYGALGQPGREDDLDDFMGELMTYKAAMLKNHPNANNCRAYHVLLGSGMFEDVKPEDIFEDFEGDDSVLKKTKELYQRFVRSSE